MATRLPARRAGTPTNITAIDLGTAAVRVVEVEWLGASGGARVVRRGSAPLPSHAWNDLSGHREIVSNAIRSALASAGSTAKSVVTCLPRHLVTLRFVQLPPGAPEQMRGMVAYEAQQYVPFPLDDVVLDYTVLSEPTWGLTITTGETLETVLMAAARRPLITDLLAVFDQAGLTLERLSVSALALAENARDALEPTALIDLEPGEIEVVVVANGRLLFTRAAAIGADRRPDVAQARAVDEVVRSFSAYQSELRQHPVAHVYLAGTGAEGDAPIRPLTEMLEMPVSRLQTPLVPPGDPEAPVYATAIGMAIQAHGPGLAPINLIPEERAVRRAQEARRRAQSGAVLLVAVLCILAVFWSFRVLRANRQYTAAAVAANQRLATVTGEQSRRQQTYDRLAALAQSVTAGLDRSHPVVDVLAAVNQALPSSAPIWLTQFEFNRGGLLTLRGNTHSAAAATDLVLRLQECGSFSDVRLGYLGDAQEDRTQGPARQNAPTTAKSASPSSGSMPALPPMSGGPGSAKPPPGPSGPPPASAPGGSLPHPSGGPPPNVPAPGRAPMPFHGPPPGGPARSGGGQPIIITPNGAPTAAPAAPPLRLRRPFGSLIPVAFQTRIGALPPKSAAAQRVHGNAKGGGKAKSQKSGEPDTLTSFIITCRINQSATNLLPSQPAPTSAAQLPGGSDVTSQ